MRVKYIGESFYVEGLTDGNIYDVVEIDGPYLRVIDDSDEDYLYAISNPGPPDMSGPGGEWEIIEDENGKLKACSGWTDIFIYPGYRFKVLDALITNFHLPESTLIMLVSALAGREHILAAYEEAVRERYRFFSFGDAMFIH